jgi:hypothetical protein
MRNLKVAKTSLRRMPDDQHSLVRHGLAGWLAIMAAVLAINPAGSAWGATATSDPVLGLMLEKGMITEDDATRVQAQVDAMRTNDAAQYAQQDSKWKISPGIKNLEIFGDLRVRFEDRSAQDPTGGKIELQRYRYAARLGLKGELFDDYYYGLRVETSSNPRSSWVTMGTSSSGVPYQGPFGKSTAGIDIGQIYLGWHPESWFDITVGKMPNPLYTTSMVWSPSINPEGLAEHFKYTVGEADLFANFSQFLYQDVNPVQTTPGFFSSLGNYTGSNPPFLLAWQGGADYHINKRVDFKLAPVLYQYIGAPANTTDTSALPDFGGVYIGQGGPAGYSGYSSGYYDGYFYNQTGINDLLVLDIPMEINFKLDKFDVRAFGDYAQNLNGGSRAEAAYLASQSSTISLNNNNVPLTPIAAPQTHDDTAYQIGVAIGSKDSLGLVNGTTAKKHSWEVRSYWQHIEQYSLDPNLIDTDFFNGLENMQGIYCAVAYGLTDNFIGTFRYGRASRINDKLGTGGSGQDIPQMNPVNQYDLFQVDLTLKF